MVEECEKTATAQRSGESMATRLHRIAEKARSLVHASFV